MTPMQPQRKRPRSSDSSSGSSETTEEHRKGLARRVTKPPEAVGTRMRAGDTDLKTILNTTHAKHNMMTKIGEIVDSSTPKPTIQVPSSVPKDEMSAKEKWDQAKRRLDQGRQDLGVKAEALRAKMAHFQPQPGGQATTPRSSSQNDVREAVIDFYREIGQELEPQLFASAKDASEIVSLRKESDNLRQNLSKSTMEAHQKNSELRRYLEEARQELAEVKAKATTEADAMKLQNLEDNLDWYTAKADELEAEKAKIQNDKALADQQLEALQADIQNKDLSLKAEQEHNQEQEAQLTHYRDEMTRISINLDDAVEQVRTTESRIKELEDRDESQTKHLDIARSLVVENEDKVERVTQERNLLEERNRHLESGLDRAQNDRVAETRTLTIQIETLNQQQNSDKQRQRSLESELELMRNDLERERSKLQAQAEAHSLEQTSSEQKQRSLESELDSVKDNLQNELEKSRIEKEGVRRQRDTLSLFKEDTSLVIAGDDVEITSAFQRHGIDTSLLRQPSATVVASVDWTKASAASNKPVKLLTGFWQLKSKMLKILYLLVHHSTVHTHQLLSIWYSVETSDRLANKERGELVSILFWLCKRVFAEHRRWDASSLLSSLICWRLLDVFPADERTRLLEKPNFASSILFNEREGLWNELPAHSSMIEVLNSRALGQENVTRFRATENHGTGDQSVCLEVFEGAKQLFIARQSAGGLPAISEVNMEDLSIFIGKSRWRICIHQGSQPLLILSPRIEDCFDVCDWFEARGKESVMGPAEWIAKLPGDS